MFGLMKHKTTQERISERSEGRLDPASSACNSE